MLQEAEAAGKEWVKTKFTAQVLATAGMPAAPRQLCVALLQCLPRPVSAAAQCSAVFSCAHCSAFFFLRTLFSLAHTALLFFLAHTASSVYWGNLFDLTRLSQVNKGPSVNVFETTIRILGGLLSAYALTKEQVYLDGAKVTCRLQLLLHCAVPHAYTQYCCTMHDRYCCTQLS